MPHPDTYCRTDAAPLHTRDGLSAELTSMIINSLRDRGAQPEARTRELEASVRAALRLEPGRRNLLMTPRAIVVAPGPPSSPLAVAALGNDAYIVSLDILATRGVVR